MNPRKTTLALIIAHITFASVLGAQPTNDLFANRAALAGKTASATASNEEATAEPGEPDHYGQPPAKSVWWTWTAPEDGITRVDTTGSSFDTILAVYTGNSISNLAEIASNDDDENGAAGTSLVSFVATAGTVYQIAVDGYYNGSENLSGDVRLNLAVNSSLFGLHSLSFNERWTDTVVTVNEDGEVFHEQRSKDASSATATLSIPGLHSLTLAEWTNTFVHLSLGSLEFDDVLGSANVLTATKAAFKLTAYDDNGDPFRAGQLVFSRSADVLTIALQATNTDYSIVAYNYLDYEGPIDGVLEFQFSFDSLNLERNVYLSGMNVITTKVIGTGIDAEEFRLNNIRLSGAADFTGPSVTLISPAPGARLTNETVNVQVRVTDLHGVDDVRFSVNDGEYEDGDHADPDLWNLELGLVPGTNVIRMIATDDDGNFTVPVLKVVRVLMRPIVVAVYGDGSISGVTNGEVLEVGKKYTVIATPAPGSTLAAIYTSNTSFVPTSLLGPGKLTFEMEEWQYVNAYFMDNPFITGKGTYQGLITPTFGIAPAKSGFFTLKVTEKGKFTGTLRIPAGSYPFSGQFAPYGNSSVQVNRQGRPPLLLFLQMDFEHSSVSGNLNYVNTSVLNMPSYLVGYQLMYSATNPAPQAGKYTLIIPGSDDSAAQPGGDGFGAVKVSTNGTVKFMGRLGDGTPVSQAAAVTGAGQWPLYLQLYGGKGAFSGWLTFTNGPDRDLDGTADWIKPHLASAKIYPAGFTNENMEVAGSLYTFTNGTPVLNFSTGQVVLAQGYLPQSFTNQFLLATDNRITNLSSNPFTLTITNSSGLFRGRIEDPLNGRTLSIRGAVFQKQNIGSGYFADTNRTGHVELGPAEGF